MSRPKTLDLSLIIQQESLAAQITDKYTTWKNARSVAEAEWTEVRNYIFATSTATTTNSKQPWKNKTVRPKLCQIRDNLHANYMAALFPNDHWFSWEAGDEQAANKTKARSIEAYMMHIFRHSRFKETVSKLVYDFIDYGNVFGDVDYVHETAQPTEGVTMSVYSGPKLLRISPLDIVFDITAPSFDETPKITRSVLSFGQIEKLRRQYPEWRVIGDELMAKLKNNRNEVISAGRGAIRKGDMDKSNALTADGFNSLYEYYAADAVELLEFEGDLYDRESGEFYPNHVITVVDRSYVIRKEPAKNWFGKSSKAHCGWRLRPDNLMAMGPLTNLIGLQYRMNHLENSKADVWDQIVHPVAKVKGYVEEFQFGPNERIYMEQDADVEFLRPDTTALNADLQIREVEDFMENMAGAPRSAMGIRTPGEKTAFEVQALENSSSRIFQSKIGYFEEFFLEGLINSMLESARRNLQTEEIVKVVDEELGVVEFLKISPEDLIAKGKLVPMGARHFAARAQLIQNLTGLTNSGIYQDPSITAHLSGKIIAQLVEENLGLSRYQIYQPNIRVFEQLETAQVQQQAQEELQVSAMTPTSNVGLEDQNAPQDQADLPAEQS